MPPSQALQHRKRALLATHRAQVTSHVVFLLPSWWAHAQVLYASSSQDNECQRCCGRHHCRRRRRRRWCWRCYVGCYLFCSGCSYFYRCCCCCSCYHCPAAATTTPTHLHSPPSPFLLLWLYVTAAAASAVPLWHRCRPSFHRDHLLHFIYMMQVVALFHFLLQAGSTTGRARP